MQRRYACIAIPGNEKRCWIFLTLLHLLVGRVRSQIAKLRGNVDATILRNPVRTVHEFLVPQHVQQRITANYRLKQIWPLRKRRSDKQATITYAIDGKLC